jgi:UDP-N-acetyl-D-mannosaminuronate dehydrogenase
MTTKALNNVGKRIKGSKVFIMGLTYKENVADTRETPVTEIIKELQEYSVDIHAYAPLLGDIHTPYTAPYAHHVFNYYTIRIRNSAQSKFESESEQ